MMCQNAINMRSLSFAARRPAPLARRSTYKVVRAFVEQNTTTLGPSGTVIPVTFEVQKRVEFGQNVKVVGSNDTLGGWEVDKGVELTWHEGHVWSATVDLPANLAAEYKLVHFVPNEPPIWEFVANRSLATDASCAGLVLGLGWNEPEASALILPVPTEAEAAEVAGPFQAAAAAVDAFAAQFEDVKFGSAATAVEPAEAIAVVEDEEEAPAEEVEAEAGAGGGVAVATTEVAQGGNSNFLKNAAATAGYMALGVAGAAALSVLAVDIADTAVLGAMAAVAGGAAFANTGAKSGKASSDGDAEGNATGGSEGRRITGAGEAGVVIAAGLLSAIDAGKAVARALDGSSASAAVEGGAGEEEA